MKLSETLPLPSLPFFSFFFFAFPPPPPPLQWGSVVGLNWTRFVFLDSVYVLSLGVGYQGLHVRLISSYRELVLVACQSTLQKNDIVRLSSLYLTFSLVPLHHPLILYHIDRSYLDIEKNHIPFDHPAEMSFCPSRRVTDPAKLVETCSCWLDSKLLEAGYLDKPNFNVTFTSFFTSFWQQARHRNRNHRFRFTSLSPFRTEAICVFSYILINSRAHSVFEVWVRCSVLSLTSHLVSSSPNPQALAHVCCRRNGKKGE